MDSLRSGQAAAASACMNAATTTAEWLSDPSQADIRLLSLSHLREAIELSTGFQDELTGLITDLLAMPSQAYLYATIPASPDSLATGAAGEVRSTVVNLGAETAREVRVQIVADSTQLDVLTTPVVTVDSLVSGESVECVWSVMMMETRFEGDSVKVVTASVLPNAVDAMTSSSSFSITVGQRAGTGAPKDDRVPSVTAIDRVYPNPSSGRQTFEISVSAGEPVSALRIYDVAGRLVATTDLRSLAPGVHLVDWDGNGRNDRVVPSGIYFAAIKTSAGLITKKVVRVR
jgi:hypothetical protein